MSDTDDIIDQQITISDRAPEVPNFGMPMLVDYHTAWPDYAREYGRAADMLEDGFTADDNLYRMAEDLKSQQPSVNAFKVGRLEHPYTQIVELVPSNLAPGFEYSGTLNGEELSYTVPSTPTLAGVLTDLELLVEAVAGVTSTQDGTKLVATATPGTLLGHTWGRGINARDMTLATDFAADMALIEDEDPSWYGLFLAPNSKAFVLAAALWTEANKKTFFPQLSDYDVIDPGADTDVASLLLALAYARTAPIWHRAIGGTEWAAAGFGGAFLAKDPGAASPAFKTLASVSVDDLRAGERTALKNKNVTRFIRQGGQNVTFEGRTPSGRFIDTTRNADYLEAQVRANIFSVFLNNDVVPYTDAGISLIKGAVEAALQACIANGILAPTPAPVVTVPKVANTSLIDRAQRILRGVEYSARFAGAIHRCVVRGTVSV